MKQKQLQLFVFVTMALAFIFTLGVNRSITHAQGQFPGYKSSIQTYNMSDMPANITLAFYRQDGSLEKTLTDIIERNRSKTYFTLPVAEGFSGSVVISSDQPIAAISNMMNNEFSAGGAYVGRSQGSASVHLPLLMKDHLGSNSWFTLQNTSSTPANVTVNYSDGTRTQATLAAHATYNFYQKLEPHTGKVFAAEISSDQPIVAVVFQEDATSLAIYSGFAKGVTNPVMPLVNANNYGYRTSIQIQNTGNTETAVTVSYLPSAAGTACAETQTIEAKQSVTFALNAFQNGSHSTCKGGELFIGSAHVAANSAEQPLTAVVNQFAGSNPLTHFAAYSSFDPESATQTVRLPLIMDRNDDYYTGINIMNVGLSPTDVECIFIDTTYTVTKTLQPNEALTDLQTNKIREGYVGSATCTAQAADAKIVGVVNQLQIGSSDDQFLVYEGFNR